MKTQYRFLIAWIVVKLSQKLMIKNKKLILRQSEKIVEIKADFNKALKRVKRKRKTLNKLERLSNQPFSLK